MAIGTGWADGAWVDASWVSTAWDDNENILTTDEVFPLYNRVSLGNDPAYFAVFIGDQSGKGAAINDSAFLSVRIP